MASLAVVRLGRWTKEILWPAKGIVAVSIVGGLLLASGQLALTQLMASIFSMLGEQAGGLDGQSETAAPWFVPSDLRVAAGLLAAIILVVIVLRNAVNALEAASDGRVVQGLQQTLHDRLLALGATWHQGRDAAEGVELVSQISRGAAPLVVQAVKYPIIEGYTILAAAYLLYFNLANLRTPIWVNIVTVLALLVIPLIFWWLSGRERQARAEMLESERSLNTEVLNSLAQPLAIAALGAEAARSARLGAALAEATRRRIQTMLRSSLSRNLMASMPTVLQALFLIYGVSIVVTADVVDPAAIGTIFAIYAFVPRVVGPLLSLVGFIGGMNAQWPILERVGSVLDAEPEIVDPPYPALWPDKVRKVALANLVFAYAPEGPRVLDGISHVFTPGRVSAVVGRSGCGKSTVLQLIARLRRPVDGDILISDTSLMRFGNADIRRHIAVVSQFTPILTDTVRANLTLARRDASDAELEEVCGRTGLWEILMRKNPDDPLGQKMMREAGANFSGGERRLVGITRLLLLKPDIFLFDEPVAGIDAHSMEPVVAAIRTAVPGTTTILVEHDLDLVQALADEICVLEAGQFVQIGPPDRLAREPGPFQQLLEARQRLVAGDGVEMEVESYPMPSLADERPPLPIAAGGKKKAFQT